ncbi:MAG: hypothetical protein M1376_09220 [Planctomycetes bacterium]|nr:hypothetical protein [Planctomycetota bacterium]
MKRIFIGAALLALLPGITNAYYGCYGYGVRYSPYAFSYHSSGLVPCDVEYTPYAFSYHNSGLVYGYGICDYGGGYVYSSPAVHHRLPLHGAPRPRSDFRHHAQNTVRPPRPPDGMFTIRQHLHAKGVDSVDINRILRVGDQLLSADFLVKDRNLLIKYWNPQGIEQLSTQEAFKQKAYANYKESWEKFAAQFQQKGGEIYYVNASEAQTIVAALDSCPKLSPGTGTPLPQTLYAKN